MRSLCFQAPRIGFLRNYILNRCLILWAHYARHSSLGINIVITPMPRLLGMMWISHCQVSIQICNLICQQWVDHGIPSMNCPIGLYNSFSWLAWSPLQIMLYCALQTPWTYLRLCPNSL